MHKKDEDQLPHSLILTKSKANRLAMPFVVQFEQFEHAATDTFHIPQQKTYEITSTLGGESRIYL